MNMIYKKCKHCGAPSLLKEEDTRNTYILKCLMCARVHDLLGNLLSKK